MRGQPKLIVSTILICACMCAGGAIYVLKTKDIPFVKMTELPFMKKKGEWSIGIYVGDSPVRFASGHVVGNPVLTRKHVSDVAANGLADPFMIQVDSMWYMFFEVMVKNEGGAIGFATSKDGISHWQYEGIVLDEPFHLSYPHVFAWQNEYWMIPESYQAKAVRLYKAVRFPEKWEFVTTLIDGDFVDPSIFRYQGRWWLFAGNYPSNNTLSLFYAEHLMGPWHEHPKSPVIKQNANIARPGGRVIVWQDRIFRYAQDDTPIYGNQVWGFEITELTTTSYAEQQFGQLPVITASGSGWNADRMHHVDPHQIGENSWIACVDGYRNYGVFEVAE